MNITRFCTRMQPSWS